MFPGEHVLVRTFTRRYLLALGSNGQLPEIGELSAQALARLSIDGMHRLREALLTERGRVRTVGEHVLADRLTSAIRDLDSRVQILDDLLH